MSAARALDGVQALRQEREAPLLDLEPLRRFSVGTEPAYVTLHDMDGDLVPEILVPAATRWSPGA